MKFALHNNEKIEATKGVKGICPSCGSELIAKCGEIKVHHWAHKGNRNCDSWWETETEWHRFWKNKFPVEWQEVVHRAPDGERHIADVKTAHGWVLEFQHSYIKPDERRSREAFYGRLIWVVDGKRRENDAAGLLAAYGRGGSLGVDSPKRRVFPKGRGLLRDWVVSQTHVFFDLGDQWWLWWLSPDSHGTEAFLQPFPLSKFLKIHRLKRIDEALEFDLVAHNFAILVAHAENRPPPPNPGRLRTRRSQSGPTRLTRRARRL